MTLFESFATVSDIVRDYKMLVNASTEGIDISTTLYTIPTTP